MGIGDWEGRHATSKAHEVFSVFESEFWELLTWHRVTDPMQALEFGEGCHPPDGGWVGDDDVGCAGDNGG